MLNDLLNRPWAARILSIVIALSLWAIVHFADTQNSPVVSTVQEIQAFTVMVEAIGTDDLDYIRSIEPIKVQLKVKGAALRLLESEQDYRVVVDVTDIKEGKHELPVTVNLPNGITLVSIYPRTVKIDLEQLVTMRMPVQLQVSGTLRPGIKAGDSVITPSNVDVTLPSSEAETLGKVVAKVDMTDASSDLTRKNVKLVALDAAGVELDRAIIKQAEVNIFIPITSD